MFKLSGVHLAIQLLLARRHYLHLGEHKRHITILTGELMQATAPVTKSS